MGNIENDLLISKNRKPWLSLLSTILLALGGLIVGNFVATFIVIGFYDLSFNDLIGAIANITAYPEYKIPYFILQGVTAIFAFLMAPLFYLYFLEKKNYSLLNPTKGVKIYPLILSALVVLVFIPVNLKFLEWNLQMQLPQFLEGLESWMKAQEELLEEVTIFLTTMDNLQEFLIAMLVIAIIPAVGEELLFRGLIQNQLQSWTKSPHWAIWIAAILFSAMHTQFFGFLPRMLLGALLGYLYFWSGNLIYPILGHFANNGVQIILLYLYQHELTNLNIDDTAKVPWAVFLTTGLITAGLVIYFKRYFAITPTSSAWHKVFSTDKTHQAEIVKSVLADHNLNPVLINKKDSAYDRFGDIEIHVTADNILKAKQIIDNDISFD